MPKGLAAAPEHSTLRVDGHTHPRSCRHIPVPFVRPSPLLDLHLWCSRLLLLTLFSDVE